MFKHLEARDRDLNVYRNFTYNVLGIVNDGRGKHSKFMKKVKERSKRFVNDS